MFFRSLMIFGVSMLALSGCSSDKAQSETIVVKAPTSEVVEKNKDTSRSFANAMKNYKPLGRVAGGYRTLDAKFEIDNDKFSEAINYAQQMNSYSFLVWKDGKILAEKYFEGYDKDLRSDTASMHKSLLALVVGAAIDDGYIGSVEDPIGKYIPEWKDDERGKILLRYFLEMNTGLKPLSGEGGLESPAYKFFADGPNVRDMMLSMDVEFAPGTKFHYMNVASQALGLVVENATGQAYDDYLSEKIWKPIGADEAYVWYNETDGFPRTYSAFMARAEDWLRLGLLVKDCGKYEVQQVVSCDYVTQMTSPSKLNPNYGWQIWLGNEFTKKRYYNHLQTGLMVESSAPFLADDMIYFDGFGGQRVYISRAENLIVVRTGDADISWDDTILPNSVMRSLTK